MRRQQLRLHDVGIEHARRHRCGREAAAWFTSNFATKLAKASSDSERWRVRRERNRFLQEHSAIIARRNFEIFDRNAWPKRGGEAPRAPPEQFA